MAFLHVRMDSMSAQKSAANCAMAAQLRAEQSARNLTKAQLAEMSGVNFETLKRILQGVRDINVTQITALAGAFGIPPATLVARAEDRIADFPVSEVRGTNVVPIRNNPREGSGADRYEGSKAADTFDPEADSPDH